MFPGFLGLWFLVSVGFCFLLGLWFLISLGFGFFGVLVPCGVISLFGSLEGLVSSMVSLFHISARGACKGIPINWDEINYRAAYVGGNFAAGRLSWSWKCQEIWQSHLADSSPRFLPNLEATRAAEAELTAAWQHVAKASKAAEAKKQTAGVDLEPPVWPTNATRVSGVRLGDNPSLGGQFGFNDAPDNACGNAFVIVEGATAARGSVLSSLLRGLREHCCSQSAASLTRRRQPSRHFCLGHLGIAVADTNRQLTET